MVVKYYQRFSKLMQRRLYGIRKKIGKEKLNEYIKN